MSASEPCDRAEAHVSPLRSSQARRSGSRGLQATQRWATVVPSCDPSVLCVSMRVQSLMHSLMTPQASHRKRVVEINMVPPQKTRGRFCEPRCAAPHRHQTILAHHTHPKGVAKGCPACFSRLQLPSTGATNSLSLGRDGRHRTTHSRWLGPGKPLYEVKAAADGSRRQGRGSCSSPQLGVGSGDPLVEIHHNRLQIFATLCAVGGSA